MASTTALLASRSPNAASAYAAKRLLRSEVFGTAVCPSQADQGVARTTNGGNVRCQHGNSARTAPPALPRRALLSAAAAAAPALVASRSLAILEADEDDELLAKVKKDRRSKIEKRTSLGSYKGEAASVQRGVYKLSKAGKAIDESDFAAASVVLGASLSADWVTELKGALSRVSTSQEERSVADTFSSSLGSLQAAVLKDDVDSAKKLFVSTAGSLEKWTRLTGLAEEILGL